VQLGAYNCTVIVGFNAQLLKYFAVLHLLSVGRDRQSILAQLTSYLSREILVAYGDTIFELLEGHVAYAGNIGDLFD
jgi:hypothetical protein